MFLHVSVILSTGGACLCMMSLPVWLPGPMFPPWGVSVPGPMILLWGNRDPHGQRPPVQRPPRLRPPNRDHMDRDPSLAAAETGSMHPTGWIIVLQIYFEHKILCGYFG